MPRSGQNNSKEDTTMDPNEALAELRQIVKMFDEATNSPKTEPSREQMQEAIKALPRALAVFAALDEWITGGGFPPDDWTVSAN